MSILKIFKQPFPYEPPPKGTFGTSAFFGLFVFLFLLLFKPFDLDIFPFYKLAWISFAYGMITFTCVFIATTALPALFPSTFNENTWTTGKHILFTTGIIFFVGLANYLFSPLLVDSGWSLYNAIWFQGITLAIAIMPICVFILYRQNRLLKKFSGQAEILDKRLNANRSNNNNNISYAKGDKENTGTAYVDNDAKKKANDDANVSNKIVLAGDYHNEKVEVYTDDLYIITSASNYIKLFHLQKEKLVYSIIRSTIKKAEAAVLDHPNFFKCHRAFIINLDKVIHVEGNAQGYKVRIEGHDELIPVSRNLNNEFSDKLLAFRKQ
jgi:DNA-binding LytR/AlgR family response regulator